MITKNGYLINDHKLFYVWLSQLSAEVNKNMTKLVTHNDLNSFFTEVCGDVNMDYTNLSLEGYACI